MKRKLNANGDLKPAAELAATSRQRRCAQQCPRAVVGTAWSSWVYMDLTLTRANCNARVFCLPAYKPRKRRTSNTTAASSGGQTASAKSGSSFGRDAALHSHHAPDCSRPPSPAIAQQLGCTGAVTAHGPDAAARSLLDNACEGGTRDNAGVLASFADNLSCPRSAEREFCARATAGLAIAVDSRLHRVPWLSRRRGCHGWLRAEPLQLARPGHHRPAPSSWWRLSTRTRTAANGASKPIKAFAP